MGKTVRQEDPMPDPVPETIPEKVEPVMGIDRYLENNPASSRAISCMLADLFKGQVATKSQWADRISEVLMRNV